MGQPRRPDQSFNPPTAAVAASGAAGTFRGRLVTVFGANGGVFVYSPTPGTNQLVASIVAQAGTDQYGNKILAGITSYVGSTAVNLGGTGLTYYTNSSGQTGTWTSSGKLMFRSASSPQLVLPSGFTGTIAASNSDSTTFTATTAAVRQLSASWDLPANDAAANTIYRLTVWGNGAQGSSANNASWSVTIGAGGNGVSSVQIITLGVAGSAWTASVTANFRLVVELQCTSAGVSGNFNADGEFLLTNNSTAAAIYAAALVDNGNTVDTTVDHKIQFNWQWASTTSGPTISSYGSILERISG